MGPGPGMGSVPRGQDVFMVLKFTGEITKGDADEFNAKLNHYLKSLNTAAAGGRGFGKVITSNASSVNVKF